MNVWSEKNKVVNVLIPVTDAFAANKTTDVINMENYKRCTFLVVTGASSADLGKITVNAGNANNSCSEAIVFKYRTQVAGTAGIAGAVGSDIPSALETATISGFAMQGAKIGGIYIVEVDAQVVAAAGADYDHVSLTVTENGTAGVDACVIAILSEPRYAQDVLATAID